MVKSMWQSKSKKEKATNLQKASSRYQRRINEMKKMLNNLERKNVLRLEQNRRDHNFISIIKENHPEVYTETIEIMKKRYPQLKKLKEIKKEVKNERDN